MQQANVQQPSLNNMIIKQGNNQALYCNNNSLLNGPVKEFLISSRIQTLAIPPYSPQEGISTDPAFSQVLSQPPIPIYTSFGLPSNISASQAGSAR